MREREAVALVELSERAWARRSPVLQSASRTVAMALRHVDRELVRRGVLASVQAGAAVVAQVRQVVNVGLA